MTGTLVYAVWFGGGLRIIDVADPLAPREVGYFIPEPVGGRNAPQSNDVMLDERGLIYMVDRHVGFDILDRRVLAPLEMFREKLGGGIRGERFVRGGKNNNEGGVFRGGGGGRERRGWKKFLYNVK